MLILKKIYTRLFIIPIRHIQYIYYIIIDRLLRRVYPDIKILSDEETVNLIIHENKSISRFGDGEINWILGKQDNSFQENTTILSKRLEEVLHSQLDNLLVCLPSTFNSLSEIDLNAKHFWSKTMYHQRFHILFHISSHIYGNSLFTRPYMIYLDKSKAEQKFNNIKLIWRNRNIVIIEGEYTFFGIGNDLLDNASSVRRIIAPNKNAFNCYDQILKEAMKIEKDVLILVALGPTATILAYDLAKLGYQAIDIGHVDIEYEWYLKRAKKKISIPGKYVNEISNRIEDKDLYKNNKIYVNSIIARIESE